MFEEKNEFEEVQSEVVQETEEVLEEATDLKVVKKEYQEENEKPLKKEKKINGALVLSILSMIFGHIRNLSLAGLIVGIIGIVKNAKSKEKSETSLALSIIGTSFSAINLVAQVITMFFVILYFILYFGIFLIAIIAGSASTGGTYY